MNAQELTKCINTCEEAHFYHKKIKLLKKELISKIRHSYSIESEQILFYTFLNFIALIHKLIFCLEIPAQQTGSLADFFISENSKKILFDAFIELYRLKNYEEELEVLISEIDYIHLFKKYEELPNLILEELANQLPYKYRGEGEKLFLSIAKTLKELTQ